MILGNLTPGYVELPLRGRPSFVWTAMDETGQPVSVDAVFATFNIYENPDDPESSPLIAKDSDDGGGLTLISPADAGDVIVDLTAAERDLLSAQRLYAFVATLTDLETGQTILTNTGYLIAAMNCFNRAQQITDSMTLSTRLLNTLTLTDVQGGSGYLDGVVTVNQSVPCRVTFAVTGEPPQDWILEASTSATDLTNGLLRPLDYDGTSNRKVWRKLS